MTVRVLYDGDCPFCRAYVRLARLREQVGEVELIDARGVPDLVEAYAARGFEVDESFIVDTGRGVLGHGAGMAFIHANLAPRWTGLPLLASPRVLNALYPSLRAMRNGALRVLGVPPIRAAHEALKPRPHTEEACIGPVEPGAGRAEPT